MLENVSLSAFSQVLICRINCSALSVGAILDFTATIIRSPQLYSDKVKYLIHLRTCFQKSFHLLPYRHIRTLPYQQAFYLGGNKQRHDNQQSSNTNTTDGVVYRITGYSRQNDKNQRNSQTQ